MFSAVNLTALFACTADLPSSSEGETRLNNLLRAEVFAGVLRAFRLDSLKNGSFGTPAAQCELHYLATFSFYWIFAEEMQ
jgi:hypothetical protein